MTRAQQTISFGLLVSSVRLLFRDNSSSSFLRTTLVLLHPLRKPQSFCSALLAIVLTSWDYQLYLALYLQLIPLPSLIQEQVVPVLPFWALVSFGALLLFRLGLGVFTFNDVPEAHKELMQEIDQAKVDLRKLGVDVD
ncbi:hypothetical protein G3M48_010531 [Beauveria asiatica]|uniref:Dolichol-phosphate mannosyltransferase subunit 3 n=1 Tax=Beauveria asiatica TaxID=1069075 RepID=A0AAW0RGZ3_9HYPO